MNQRETLNQADVDAIVRAIEDEYATSFTRRDAKTFVSLFADTATLLTEWGHLLRGRAAIESAFAGVMGKLPPDLEVEITPVHARAVTEDVLVSHGRVLRRGGGGEADETLHYSRVYVWDGDMWRIALAQVAPSSRLPDVLGAPASP